MSVDNTLSFDSHVFGKSSLSEILKLGARRLLIQAVDQEVEDYINRNSAEKDENGKRLVVRNGFSKQRTIQTGIGPIDISMPRVYDKRPDKTFTSKILPPYLRKTKEIEELIPWLYLGYHARRTEKRRFSKYYHDGSIFMRVYENFRMLNCILKKEIVS
jgi:hypothetical protein